MVIGIIAMLMGIVTTAASSSIKSSRKQRADALCTIVQTALATYREQKGKWPISMPVSRANNEGANSQSVADVIVLDWDEARRCVLELVKEAKNGNPMMDISGLFVTQKENHGEVVRRSAGNGFVYEVEKKAYGMGFMDAVRGTKRSKKKMKTDNMNFGYPDPETGYFLRFKMTYSIPTDSISVGKWR